MPYKIYMFYSTQNKYIKLTTKVQTMQWLSLKKNFNISIYFIELLYFDLIIKSFLWYIFTLNKFLVFVPIS